MPAHAPPCYRLLHVAMNVWILKNLQKDPVTLDGVIGLPGGNDLKFLARVYRNKMKKG